MLRESIELHRQGRLEEAEQGYRSVLATNPADLEALRLLAGLRRQRGDLNEAARLAEAAHHQAPEQPAFLALLGAIQYDAGNHDQSKDAYERALALNPNIPGAHTCLGHIALLRGNLKLAEECFRTALRVNEDPQALTGLGMVLLNSNDAEMAIKYFTRAADIAPKDAGVQFSLGRGFAARGMHAFAEQAYLNALRLRPGLPQATHALGQLFIETGRGVDAEKLMRSLLEVKGFELTAELGVADALRSQKRMEEAVEGYRAVLRRAPNHQAAASVLIWTLGQMERPVEALEVIDAQCARYPEHLGWLEQRARMLTILQRYPLALTDWQKIVDLDPSNIVALNHVAQLREWGGENELGFALANEVAKTFPDDDQIALVRVRGMLRNDDNDGAFALISEMGNKGMSEGSMRMRLNYLGRLLDRRGEYDKAALAFREAQQGFLSMMPGLNALPDDIARILDEPVVSAIDSAPIFLLGAPGSGVEYVAGLLSDQPGLSVLRDRATDRRGDCFDGRPYEKAIEDISDDEIKRLHEEYLAAVRRVGGAPEKPIVDWIPHWDAHLLATVKRVFPGAKIVVVERDPRDALLNWLAFGWIPLGAMSDFEQAVDWSVRANRHLRHGIGSKAIPHQLVDSAALLADPAGAGADLAKFIGIDALQASAKFAKPTTLGGLAASFESGHWKAYQTVLSDAFARVLAPDPRG